MEATARGIALGTLLLCTSPAFAAEPQAAPAESQPGWEFLFAPYVWGAGLDGTVEADDVSADVDVSFSDILDDLDAGVIGSFEARRERFSLTTNLVYLKLSPEAEQPIGAVLPGAPPGSFEVRSAMETLIFEVRPTYEVLSLPLFDETDPQRISLDLGPGARVWRLKTHLDEKLDWVDFVAAGRVRVRLTEKLGLVVAGDFGGFDIGSSSHRTWSLLGLFSYSLGESWDLAAGWRTLNLDRGPVDLDMAGPLIGAAYRF